jgi:hypothetical protein
VKVTAAPVSGACPAGRDGRARTARRPGGDRPPGRGPTLGGGIRPRRAIRSGPHRPASQESHHITSFTIDVPVIRVSRYIPAWHRAKTFFIALASAWTCIYPAPENSISRHSRPGISTGCRRAAGGILRRLARAYSDHLVALYHPGGRRLSGGRQIGAGYRGGRLSPGRPQPCYLMFTQVTSGSGMHPRCYTQQQTCPSSMVSERTRSVSDRNLLCCMRVCQ